MGPIRSNHKDPSLALHSAKTPRKHIVDFKTLFYPARLCTKTNWISVNGKKIHPWDGFELNSFAYPTTHEEVGPRDVPSTRDGI